MLNMTGSMASSLGTIQPFRYRGYVYDVETEKYYLKSRYYSAGIGRFANTDILLKLPYLSNGFCYCNNNAVVRVDTTGFASEYIYIVEDGYYYDSNHIKRTIEGDMVLQRFHIIDENDDVYFTEYKGNTIELPKKLCKPDIAYDLVEIWRFAVHAKSARDGEGLYLAIGSEYNNPEDVYKLQMLLKRVIESKNYEGLEGYNYTNLITGEFDSNTVTLVKWYQKRNSLKDDGKAGRETFASLCETAYNLCAGKEN